MRGRGTGATSSAAAAFERDARRWLRAYPPRWRAEREEEVIGVLAEIAGPDPGRLAARDRWDLLRQGLATRWRGRPPLVHWLAYRLFDRRIPRAWTGWAADDIAGAWYPVRSYLGSTWFLALWFALVPGVRDVRLLVTLAVVAGLTPILWPEAQRRQRRAKHLVPRSGEPVGPGAHLPRPAPRVRVEARAGWTATAVVSGAFLAAGALSSFLGPKALHTRVTGRASWEHVVAPVGEYRVAVVAPVVVALAVGLVLAVVGRRRVRRVLPQRPAQPNRVQRPVRPTEVIGLTVVVALAVALAWAELTGRLVVGFGAVLAVAGAVVLPSALAVLRELGRDGWDDVAAVDVRWVLLMGTAPRVEAATTVPVPVRASDGYRSPVGTSAEPATG